MVAGNEFIGAGIAGAGTTGRCSIVEFNVCALRKGDRIAVVAEDKARNSIAGNFKDTAIGTGVLELVTRAADSDIFGIVNIRSNEEFSFTGLADFDRLVSFSVRCARDVENIAANTFRVDYVINCICGRALNTCNVDSRALNRDVVADNSRAAVSDKSFVIFAAGYADRFNCLLIEGNSKSFVAGFNGSIRINREGDCIAAVDIKSNRIAGGVGSNGVEVFAVKRNRAACAACAEGSSRFVLRAGSRGNFFARRRRNGGNLVA